ncbi:MAG TPA: TetR/AcrR family transcriptional regulator [Thermotogota bacterium]|nr:TetR/AcrR family transcriptional regulator [Thermotogota bacterium]HPJ90074.1 TetR/AcrR family transcriptional regulator [Thermotogota bacterium]HPR96873.1 TetR/AcrR family transcriptional regulator [Thermotogota bacterium]
MPPRQKIHKDQIVSTATEIALEKGIKEINIRSIAKRLNCSIAPIYVNFKSVDELIAEVSMKIQRIMESFMSVQYCDFPLVNLGIGVILFAERHRSLYRELIFSRVVNDDQALYINKMKEDPLLQGLRERDRTNILNKLSIITAGLGIEAACGENDKDISRLLELLFEIGMDVINSTRLKNGLQEVQPFYDKNLIRRIVEEYLPD